MLMIWIAYLVGGLLGFWLGRATAPSGPPRIRFYPHAQTGLALRRRLFGGD